MIFNFLSALFTQFSLFLYPLQLVDFTDFAVDDSTSNKHAIIFLIVFPVFVAIIVLVNKFAKKMPSDVGIAKKSGKTAAKAEVSFGLFSGFALRRIAREIGLNKEQTKMLDFVLRTDQVSDIERSINSSELLDRHFRRAYRVLESAAGTDEDKQNKIAVLFSTRNKLETNVSSGLESTKQLKENSAVIVTDEKGRHNLSVISASSDYLALECPENALGSPIKVPKGTVINAIVFIKNNKGFSFSSKVAGYSSVRGHSALLINHSNKLNPLSQRRFRRRQAVIAANLYLVYVEGSGKKQRLIVDKRRLSGNIADISVGGCSINVKAAVQVGSRLKIEFAQGTSSVAALGQVLRTNKAGMATILHIKFLRVSRKSMNTINAFVYEFSNE